MAAPTLLGVLDFDGAAYALGRLVPQELMRMPEVIQRNSTAFFTGVSMSTCMFRVPFRDLVWMWKVDAPAMAKYFKKVGMLLDEAIEMLCSPTLMRSSWWKLFVDLLLRDGHLYWLKQANITTVLKNEELFDYILSRKKSSSLSLLKYAMRPEYVGLTPYIKRHWSCKLLVDVIHDFLLEKEWSLRDVAKFLLDREWHGDVVNTLYDACNDYRRPGWSLRDIVKSYISIIRPEIRDFSDVGGCADADVMFLKTLPLQNLLDYIARVDWLEFKVIIGVLEDRVLTPREKGAVFAAMKLRNPRIGADLMCLLHGGDGVKADRDVLVSMINGRTMEKWEEFDKTDDLQPGAEIGELFQNNLAYSHDLPNYMRMLLDQGYKFETMRVAAFMKHGTWRRAEKECRIIHTLARDLEGEICLFVNGIEDEMGEWIVECTIKSMAEWFEKYRTRNARVRTLIRTIHCEDGLRAWQELLEREPFYKEDTLAWMSLHPSIPSSIIDIAVLTARRQPDGAVDRWGWKNGNAKPKVVVFWEEVRKRRRLCESDEKD